MKLRNKKTGQEGNFIINKDHFECVDLDCVQFYFSLSELLDEWEDCKPAEPLIKDEKIRKAVRAWWEAVSDNMTDKRIIYKNNQDLAVGIYTIYCGAIYPETLEVGKMYTINELCGE